MFVSSLPRDHTTCTHLLTLVLLFAYQPRVGCPQGPLSIPLCGVTYMVQYSDGVGLQLLICTTAAVRPAAICMYPTSGD